MPGVHVTFVGKRAIQMKFTRKCEIGVVPHESPPKVCNIASLSGNNADTQAIGEETLYI